MAVPVASNVYLIVPATANVTIMVVQPNSLRKLIQRKRQLNEKYNISGWANCDSDTENKIKQFCSKRWHHKWCNL